jgi:cyclopropane fatty-acyl-phospholipid synthase-like methyltransferase
MFQVKTSEGVIRQKNGEIYDDTAGEVWRLAVYEPVHHGWEFINLGGATVLDRMAADSAIGPDTSVIELCSGQGAACRYLATHFGCTATGVELNAGQFANAVARLREDTPAVSARVAFVHADILRFRPTLTFDVACSLDSLMLIEDVPAALRTAFACLRPGGTLTFVTIGAGPALDDAMRRFAWECDGMITLADGEQYRQWLEGAGFVDVVVDDLTDLAVQRSIDLETAVTRNRDAIVRAEGECVYRGWVDVGAVYLRGFQARRLGYPLITARRPDTIVVS